MNWEAKWIAPERDMGDVCPSFTKTFFAKDVQKATLTISAMSVYEARLNGKRVGNYILAPGWTSYQTRLQYQEYDVSALLQCVYIILQTIQNTRLKHLIFIC